jgi:hypothetical protein
MLWYLELDYSMTPIKTMTSWNRNRVLCYLHRLRDDVVLELMGEPTHILQEPTFSTNVLREWAIRVYGGYGHSRTGRQRYQKSCRSLGVTPYCEDFINYGNLQTFIC